MADLNLKRAHALLKSARELYEQGELAGVAGLAYQAFESAMMALAKEKDRPNHAYRCRLAVELLHTSQESINKLWEARNVDFYGNEKIGQTAREIELSEVEICLNVVEEFILAVENLSKRK